MSSAIQPALPTTAGGWLLGVLAALAIKLSTSVDDVAWLLPFVASSTRSANMQRALQYIATNFFVASVACGVALGGGAAIAEVTDDDSPWPSERVLGMCSGLALSLYSLYLFKGFLEERNEAMAEARTQRAADALASIVRNARAAEAFFAESQQQHQPQPAEAGLQLRTASENTAQEDSSSAVWIWIEALQGAVGLTPGGSRPRPAAADGVVLTRSEGARAGAASSCFGVNGPSASAAAAAATSESAVDSMPVLRTQDLTALSSLQTPPARGSRGRVEASTTAFSPYEREAPETLLSLAPSPAANELSTPSMGLHVERCRALQRLRGALGEEAYVSRKQRLLHELLSAGAAESLEAAAEALHALHASGFVESEAELAIWADGLLGAQAAGIIAASEASRGVVMRAPSSEVTMTHLYAPPSTPHSHHSTAVPDTPRSSPSSSFWRGRIPWSRPSPRSASGAAARVVPTPMPLL